MNLLRKRIRVIDWKKKTMCSLNQKASLYLKCLITSKKVIKTHKFIKERVNRKMIRTVAKILNPVLCNLTKNLML